MVIIGTLDYICKQENIFPAATMGKAGYKSKILKNWNKKLKKKIDLQYIQEQGLRDVEIKEISIDHTGKRVELTLSGFSGTKVLKMELKEITLLATSKLDTFYSPEIILEYQVDEKKSEINIYTSSDSVYRIKFDTYSFWMGKAVDFVQGMEEFSCKVDLQDNQALKKPGLSNTPAFGHNKAGNVL